MIIFQILLFILVLSFLVIIHELGHYLAAKICRVKIEEFGIGYPPLARKLFTFRETVFSLNWIPFGGFVRMKGEDGPQNEEHTKDQKDKKTAQTKDAFFQKSVLARLFIVLAGATINLVFGILAFIIYFSLSGIPILVPKIEQVQPNTPAARANLPEHVQVFSFKVGNKEVRTASVDDVKSVIAAHQGETVTITVIGDCDTEKCHGQPQNFSVYLRKPDEIPAGQGSLGIVFAQAVEFHFYPWYEMPFRGTVAGLEQSFFLVKMIFQFLGQTVQSASHGQIPAELGSPIKVFIQGRELGFFSQGFLMLLNFAAIISINLAVFNVLPIPALDGGRAVMILAEKIVGKRRVGQVEGYLNYGGFVFLLGLMTLFFARDIIELLTPLVKKLLHV